MGEMPPPPPTTSWPASSRAETCNTVRVTQPYGYGPPPAGPYYPPPPPTSPAGQPLADFGSRLGAWLIDSAIVSAALLVVTVPAMFAVFFTALRPAIDESSVDNSTLPGDFIVTVLLVEGGIILLAVVLQYVYQVEMMYRSGQTVGKRAMRLRVIPIDPARRLTRGMAATRFLVQFVVGAFVPFFNLFDGLWMLWDKPYLQTLHDKAAETVVIKVSP
jgi:uncharacterized RDD family membrane protein YckC